MKYISLLLVTILATTAFAATFDETLELAEKGDAEAQYNLGQMYRRGEGVPEDAMEAATLFKMSAAQGNAKAQKALREMRCNSAYDIYTLALISTINGITDSSMCPGEEAAYERKAYQNGLKQCKFEIVAECLESVEQGDAIAQFNLAKKYREGNGVIENDAKALGLLKKSAEQGNGDAQASLANMYHSGEGVTKNNIKAYIWASMAKRNLRNVPIYSIKSELSSRQLNKAQQLASECYESDYKDCEPWFAW